MSAKQPENHRHAMHDPASPLVVQVGFAGSRVLYDRAQHAGVNQAVFDREVEDHLAGVLERLPMTLGLVERHFLSGISSAAVGADSRFIRACAQRGVAQRIYLPEHRKAFLSAESEEHVRDFTEAQQADVVALLASPHIIEERVVSVSGKREQRFEDVNLEIVRVSDVLIALSREGAKPRPGGTRDLIDRAKARGKYVLEITVSVQEGRARFVDKWHPRPPLPRLDDDKDFRIPQVPKVLANFRHEDQAGYVQKLQDFTDALAGRHQWFFKMAAFAIIGTHVVATMLATGNLAFLTAEDHHHASQIILVIEIVLLLAGFAIHVRLHRKSVVERWATERLLAEVCRSVDAVSGVRGYLQHLFQSTMPQTIWHILRTLNFIHLKETQPLAAHDWKTRRDKYVEVRFDHLKSGQIPYYSRQRERAQCRVKLAQAVFYIGSGLAIAMALLEIGWHHSPRLSFLTVVLPVVSVASLSLAASFDLEARLHTYEEMVAALKLIREHLVHATSEGEFHHLAMQTETRIVGENAAWYARRVFISVT